VQARTADLAYPFGNVVGRREDLCCMLVAQKMIVPEMPARHVPVEIFRFHVQRKHVRQQDIECAEYVPDSICSQVCWRLERGGSQSLGVTNVHPSSPSELRNDLLPQQAPLSIRIEHLHDRAGLIRD
jgi:hypothetical protein